MKTITGIFLSAVLLFAVSGVVLAETTQFSTTTSSTSSNSNSGGNNQNGNGSQTTQTGNSNSGANSFTVGNVNLDIDKPVKTPKPTSSPIVTPTSTPAPTNNNGGSSSNNSSDEGCATHDCSTHPSTSQGQVLGASTMGKTGSFDEMVYQAIMTVGATLTSFGVKGLKKAKKVSKK